VLNRTGRLRRATGHADRGAGRIATIVAATCAVVSFGAAVSSAAIPTGSVAELLPDLRTRAPAELYVQGGDLRLSNTIVNRGVGPLEIFPETTDSGDCDSDGDESNDRLAFQRVFQDSADPASPGFFVRNQDTASNSRLVGCMVYHPEHSHWHLEDFSAYTLRSEATGQVEARALKVSFCVIDTDHLFPALPGSPSGFYGNHGCGRRSVEGMSIGWADTYGASLPGQSVEISGLPAGDYCLISRADPSNRLQELSDGNNRRRTRISLDPAAQDVQVLPGACQL